VLAKQRTVIEQLPTELVDNAHVATVEVIVAETAKEKLAQLEAKAAEKRVSAGLAPFDIATSPIPTSKDEFPTVPFEVMFPLVLKTVTQEWGLTEGKGTPVKLRVNIEMIKTANAAMAILLFPSSDELAGIVEVLSVDGTKTLGSFYVHVVNMHSGWGGMLIRGGGIREKLVEEFGLESSRILTGSTKKDWKKRVKERQKAQATTSAGK
jgi:hypothetical protein